MASLPSRGPFVAGMIMAAPILLIGAPLVLADVYLRPAEPSVAECRAVLAKAAVKPPLFVKPVKVAARPVSRPAPPPVRAVKTPITLFSPAQIAASLAPLSKVFARPAMTASVAGAPRRVAAAAPAPARVRGVYTPPAAPPVAAPARPVRVAALGRTAPLPRAATVAFAPLSCAGLNGQGLACGSAMAQKPVIQAQLSYSRLNTRCAGLLSAYGRGGLEGAMIYAMNGSQMAAKSAGMTGDAEAAQVRRALQKALIITAATPKDVLSALSDLETAYGGCDGYDAARNALRSTASLIQAQLGVDQPTATPGYGAAFANPGLPATGALGTSSYSTIVIH